MNHYALPSERYVCLLQMSLVIFLQACIYMETYSSIWVKFGFHRNCVCLFSTFFSFRFISKSINKKNARGFKCKKDLVYCKFLCGILLNQNALNPIPLYKQGVEEEKSELARLVNESSSYQNKKIVFFISFQSCFAGAMAVGDLVKTTLGPKGMVNPR